MNEIIIESFYKCPLCKTKLEKYNNSLSQYFTCYECGVNSIITHEYNFMASAIFNSVHTNSNSTKSMYFQKYSKNILGIIEICEEDLYNKKNIFIRLSVINKSNSDRIHYEEIDLNSILLPYDITSVYYKCQNLIDKYSTNQDIL